MICSSNIIVLLLVFSLVLFSKLELLANMIFHFLLWRLFLYFSLHGVDGVGNLPFSARGDNSHGLQETGIIDLSNSWGKLGAERDRSSRMVVKDRKQGGERVQAYRKLVRNWRGTRLKIKWWKKKKQKLRSKIKRQWTIWRKRQTFLAFNRNTKAKVYS